MAVTSTFKEFERISDVIGGESALRLCAWQGGVGRSAYIPQKPIKGHLLEKLLGSDAFTKLCDAFGGGNLPCPAIDLRPLRSAGRVWSLRNSGLSGRQIANLVDLTPARISQIQATLRLEGFFDLSTELGMEGENHD